MMQFALFVFYLHAFTVQAGKIQAFYSANYIGLMFEVEATPGCIKVPPFGNDRITSIKSDVCIMVYQDYCDGRSFKIPPSSKDGINLEKIDFAGSLHKDISSFQVCTEKEGGDTVNVDIFKQPNYTDLQAQYTNVCGCIEIPEYLHGNVGSIDNHGNGLRTFLTTDCTGLEAWIRPGKNEMSEHMGRLIYPGATHRRNNMKSFQPLEIPLACYKFTATVYRYEMISTFSKHNIGNVELASSTQFRNNGNASITKEYSKAKTFTNLFEVTRSEGLRSLTTVSWVTAPDFQFTFGAEPNGGMDLGTFKIGNKFKFELVTKTALKQAFSFSTHTSNQTSKKFTKIEENEFRVSDKFEIPPCTAYDVSSFIKVFEDVPIDYTVYLKVTGNYNDKPVGKEELKKKLKELEHVGDQDEWTVLAKTTGVMRATVGLEGVVDGVGTFNPECHNSKWAVEKQDTSTLKSPSVLKTTATTEVTQSIFSSTKHQIFEQETDMVDGKSTEWLFILKHGKTILFVGIPILPFLIAACCCFCACHRNKYDSHNQSTTWATNSAIYYFK